MTAPTSVLDVQARISNIQYLINGRTARPSPGDGFGAALQSAMGSTSTSAGAAAGTAGRTTGDDVIADARKYLGVPYKWGGTDERGFDCSGLVQQVYQDLGIDLPRTAAQQARQGTKVASLDQAAPGDLVAFGSPVDHIGIYAGDGMMLVAPKAGDVVKLEKVYTTPTAIRRILPEATPAIAGAGLGAPATAGLGSLSSSYDALFQSAGSKYGVSPRLLAAVAKQESGFDPNAVSPAGARGLMQLMPGTASGLGVDPMDPAQAIDGAARMLAGLTQQFGSSSLALAAYNAGPGNVTKYGGIPPFAETQRYVRNVLASSQGA